ncbi:MAG: hypothetical protein ACLSVD_05115 [Eggerthellaceae bacterium]
MSDSSAASAHASAAIRAQRQTRSGRAAMLARHGIEAIAIASFRATVTVSPWGSRLWAWQDRRSNPCARTLVGAVGFGHADAARLHGHHVHAAPSSRRSV